MSASNLTSVSFIYKKLYMQGQPGDLAMRNHPAFAMCSREGKFTGTDFTYMIRYGNPQGISGTFTVAQTNAAGSKGVQLSALRRPKFGVITMDGEAMASSDSRGAFMDLVTQETDGILEEMGDSLAFDFYRGGHGHRGVISANNSDVLTLTVADDARSFKVGMIVGADSPAGIAADNGVTPLVGTATVTAVDEDAGTVTIDATPAGWTSGTGVGDTLFREGDPGTCMEGLSTLFPLAAPAVAENFRGIDRSVDPRRLAGVRVDDTATAIEENAGLVAVKISQVGQKADKIYLNPINFWQVVRRLNAKVEYQNGGGKADYGFEYFMIHTPAGSLRAYSDPDCPVSRGYVCSARGMFIKHRYGVPHIISDDGRPNLREANADGVEARARAWVNLIHKRPGSNGVFSI